MALTLRVTPYLGTAEKGLALSHEELDNNFITIDTKLNKASNYVSGSLSGTTFTVTVPWVRASLTDLIGTLILVKNNGTLNSGNVNVSLTNGRSDGDAFTSALTAVAKNDNTTLVGGEIPAGQIVALVYDGANFELLTDYGSYYTKSDLNTLDGPFALTAGSITSSTFNFNTHTNYTLTLSNGTASTLTSVGGTVGKYASVRVVQSASGGCSLSYVSAQFKGMSGFTLSTVANAVDWLLFRISASGVAELVGYRNDVGA
jgi:hypothetical protein